MDFNRWMLTTATKGTPTISGLPLKGGKTTYIFVAKTITNHEVFFFFTKFILLGGARIIRERKWTRENRISLGELFTAREIRIRFCRAFYESIRSFNYNVPSPPPVLFDHRSFLCII